MPPIFNQDVARAPRSKHTAVTALTRPAANRPSQHRARAFASALAPADGTMFFLLGGRPAVFCEPSQQIYELNQVAGYIWCRLEEQASAEAICAGLTQHGITPALAGRHFQEAVRHWLKLGLLKADGGLPDGLPVARSFNLSIAHFEIAIHLSNERLERLFSSFAHLLAPARPCEHVFHVVELEGLVHVLHNELNVICCERRELVPSFKAYITEQLLKTSAPHVAFHAACLIRGGKSMLISGRPGAGKTTLALRLAEAGFDYAGDDIVLLAPDGTATGVPFPAAVKSGAWEIVSRFCPDILDLEVHRRPDARRVRYLRPARIAYHGGYPVGWIVFIRRAPGPAKLKPLEPVETMRRLMAGSRSGDGNLSRAECRAINHAVGGAGSFELTYSNLTDANHTIVRLCNG